MSIIRRRHVGYKRDERLEQNRKAVLEAVRTLVSQRRLPTTRVIGKMTGIYSPGTVSKHLRYHTARGELVPYRYRSGYVYLPASESKTDSA